jgi:hypothetical protein
MPHPPLEFSPVYLATNKKNEASLPKAEVFDCRLDGGVRLR